MSKRHDLLIYSFPYRGRADLQMDRMIEVRDSVLRRNIEGSEQDLIRPQKRDLISIIALFLDPKRTEKAELRRLWKMTGGAMMGGPFVSQAIYDKAGIGLCS